MRYSLGFVLALSLAGLQFLAILIVVTTSYVSSERAMLDHARGLLADASATAIEYTKGFLEPAQEAAELSNRLIREGIVDPSDFAALELFFLHQLWDDPHLSGIYYGDEQGNFTYVMRSLEPGPFRSKFISIDGNERSVEYIWRSEDGSVIAQDTDPTDTFDPRQRPWYIDAHDSQASVWTDPYIFFSSRQPGITVSSPVLTEGASVSGVVGVDIEISDVSLFLSQLPIGARGRALILSEDGQLIAHPDFAEVTDSASNGDVALADLESVSDPLTRASITSLEAEDKIPGETIQSGFQHDGENYLSLVGPMTSTNLPWLISVFVPENDFIQDIKNNRRRNIWIAALISLLTAIAGLTLAEIILRPVRAFAVRTALISQGEVAPEDAPPRTYRELQNANQTLISEIAERRRLDTKIQDLNRDLSHASRINVMGQLATGLAHELSQPLTAITQNVDTAISLAKQDGVQRDELLAVLDELDEQAHQGGDIVRTLRGYVRKDENTAEFFNLDELVAQTIRLLRHDAKRNQVDVTRDLPEVPRVYANRVEIAQILTNLMRNSIEAMAQAGSKSRTIHISGIATTDHVQVCVEDTGPGIMEGLILFKQFQSSKPDGLGLGHSISKTIAEANGGKLWLETSEPQRTRFAFTIPLEPKNR